MTPPSCTHCGQPCELVVHFHWTPPWLCRDCRRGWWNAELTRTARATYRRERRDYRPAQPMKEAVRRERVLAAQRGTSVWPEHAEHLTDAHIRTLAGMRLTTDMAAVVAERLKGMP